MANEQHQRDRGNLFENAEKKKPSQPDLQGECRIAGVDYEMRAWRRDDQLTLAVAPPRRDRNTYPPDTFRGALEPGVKSPARGGRGKDEAPVAAWQGDIIGDEAAYNVRGFAKQGKSGTYFTLSFDPIEKPAPVASTFESDEPVSDVPDDDDDVS